MAVINRKWTTKYGAQKTVDATLKDKTKALINLDSWGTVTLTVSVKGSLTPFMSRVMTKSDQTANTGQVTYEFTNADYEASNGPGEYDVQIKAINPLDKLEKWPDEEGVPFGTLVILRSHA